MYCPDIVFPRSDTLTKNILNTLMFYYWNTIFNCSNPWNVGVPLKTVCRYANAIHIWANRNFMHKL